MKTLSTNNNDEIYYEKSNQTLIIKLWNKYKTNNMQNLNKKILHMKPKLNPYYGLVKRV